MIIRRTGERAGRMTDPTAVPGVTRVNNMKVLGVMLSDTLKFDLHIDRVCCRARQSMYALRILTAHGLSGPRLHDVVRATTLARMLYAAPAWWGFAGQQQRVRLQSIMNKLIRKRYLPCNNPSVEQLCRHADTTLFSAVLCNPSHVLHRLLPPAKSMTYCLRPRSHDRVLPQADIRPMRKPLLSECCTLTD